MPETSLKKASISFTEYIRKLPAAWIFSHFLKNAASGRKILSLSAAQEQVKSFSRPESLIRQFNGLGPELQLLCALTYLHGDSGLPVSGKKLSLDDELIRSFLVCGAQNARGELRYFGFAEFESSLRPLCAQTLCRAASLKDTASKVKTPALRHGNALNDVVAVAALAFQGFLERKKNGGLTSSAQMKIQKLLPWPAQLAVSYGNFLLAYGIHAGILCEETALYSIDQRKFDLWIAGSEKERSAGLVRFAVTHGGGWRVELLEELFRSAPGAWFSSELFQEKERAIETLRVLHFAGLIELSHAGSLSVFSAPAERETVTPAIGKTSKSPVVVLPDFTVVLSQEVPPAELACFCRVGELHSLDRVYKGSICRSVIRNSLSEGMEGDAMIDALTGWQAPGNVVATVREWIREFFRLHVTDCQMLVVTDGKVAAQIRSFPPLDELLEPIPAHSLFRIRSGAGESVRNILGQMGFDHRMPCSEAKVTAAAADRPAEGIIDVWEPVISEETASAEPVFSMRGKKYGSGLKKLDLNETLHIIDYAILTGQELSLDYAGSPLVRKGLYSLVPRGCSKGADPLLEGTLKNGFKKLFHVRRIDRIGVGKP